VKLLIKDPFTEFVGLFKKLPWEIRSNILEIYEGENDTEKLRSLYRDVMDETIDPDDWKSLLDNIE
jgi:hypothetical protein